MFPGEDSGELAEIGGGGVGTLERGVGTPVESCGGMVLMTGEHMGRGWRGGFQVLKVSVSAGARDTAPAFRGPTG